VIDERRAIVEHLGALLRDDRIDLESFEVATERVLATTTQDELAVVVATLPGPVRMTPAHRRMDRPLRLETSSGRIHMTSPWQLAEETSVRCRSGNVRLDLSQAEFDSDVVDLDIDSTSGRVEVIIPYGVGVQLVDVESRSGSFKNKLDGAVSVPGLPTIRISVSTHSGSVVLRRPSPPKTRRRWFTRR
jgi:hypothetical protein